MAYTYILIGVLIGLCVIVFAYLDSPPPNDKPSESRVTSRWQMSPVIIKDGKRMRRTRKDGTAYSPDDNILDDTTYEDCFELLSTAIFLGEVLYPFDKTSHEVKLVGHDDITVEMKIEIPPEAIAGTCARPECKGTTCKLY